MIQPYHPRSLTFTPIRHDGETASGIVIQHHHSLPFVLGRVTAIGPSMSEPDIQPGAVIVFRQNAWDRETTADGQEIYFTHESSVRAILEGYDEASGAVVE